MDLPRAFQEAHREHADILEFLNIFEEVLQLAASDDCDARSTGLRQLQATEGKIVEIWEHCHKEEDAPNGAPFSVCFPCRPRALER